MILTEDFGTCSMTFPNTPETEKNIKKNLDFSPVVRPRGCVSDISKNCTKTDLFTYRKKV